MGLYDEYMEDHVTCEREIDSLEEEIERLQRRIRELEAGAR